MNTMPSIRKHTLCKHMACKHSTRLFALAVAAAIAVISMWLPLPTMATNPTSSATPETVVEPVRDKTLATPLAIWRQWRDPALQALLEQAHRNAPTLAQAEARLREARAQLRQTAAERKPVIDLGGGAQRSRFNDRERLLDPQGGRYASQFDLSMSWRWNLDVFGAGAAQRDAARWRADAEAVALEAAGSELSAEVARQYVLIRSGDVQQQRERALLALLQEQERIDAALIDAGLLAAQERFASRAERQAREAGLRDGEIGRSRALLALRALGAGDLDAIEHMLALQAHVSPAQNSLEQQGVSFHCRRPVPQEWPVSALARRFDLRIAEYNERAVTADTRAALRSRWPSLTLSGRGGWVGDGIGDLVRPSNLGAQLLASLGVSLLDFGRLKAQSHAAQAREDAARAQFAQTALRATEEVDATLLSIEQATHAIERHARASKDSDTAAEVVRRRWRAGLDSRREAIAAERDALERAIVKSSAEQQLCEAKIVLSLALALPEYDWNMAATDLDHQASR
jgi:outer membrane protein TolC